VTYVAEVTLTEENSIAASVDPRPDLIEIVEEAVGGFEGLSEEGHLDSDRPTSDPEDRHLLACVAHQWEVHHG